MGVPIVPSPERQRRPEIPRVYGQTELEGGKEKKEKKRNILVVANIPFLVSFWLFFESGSYVIPGLCSGCPDFAS